jgi:hypothetical protein
LRHAHREIPGGRVCIKGLNNRYRHVDATAAPRRLLAGSGGA